MEKITIDCRMVDSGGIGAYVKELIPFFLRDFQCNFLVYEKDFELLQSIIDSTQMRFGEIDSYIIHICDVEMFSLKEMFLFPKNLVDSINEGDAFWTPYCNIPGNIFHRIKVPVFSTIHDVVFLDVPGLSSKIGTIARKLIYSYACKKSKAIFTVSEFSKRQIIRHLKTKKPLYVTHSAIQPFLEVPVAEKIEKDNSILFVGNIKKHKGLRTLLDALRILIEKNFDCKVVIVGNSEKFRTGDETIKAEIDSFPEGKIVFTGKISDEELKSYYEKARLLVQPSFYEGFGLPPLEALTCGTNAVISDLEVFKEIYGDSGFPVVFFKTGDENDLADKIQSAFNLPSPENFPKIYTFEATYNFILEGLKL